MKFAQHLALLLVYVLTLPAVVIAGDDNDDEYQLFYFDASVMDFTDGAIYPKSCITQ